MWELYVHFGLLLSCTLICAVKYRQLGTGFRLLGLLLLITILVEGYAAALMLSKSRTRNLYLYHYLTPIQYVFYALVFYKASYSRRIKNAIICSIPLFVASSVYITVYHQGLSEFNSYSLSLNNVLITCWALAYYKEVFSGMKIDRLDTEPMFWVSTGLFFHSLGSFFVYGLMNELLEQSYELAHTLYYITLFLGYFLYITFIIAFLLHRRATLL